MTFRVPVFLLLTISLLLPPSGAHAQAYSYRDDRGRVHYTDNPASVPARFRGRVEERIMRPIPGLAPSTEAEAANDGIASEFKTEFLREFFAQVNADRKNRGIAPLSLQQRQSFESWIDTWMTPLIAAYALSLLMTLSLLIHGLMNSHIGWALAGFFLWIPQPFYVLLHVAEDSVPLRVFVFLLVMAPLAIGGFATWSLKSVLVAVMS